MRSLRIPPDVRRNPRRALRRASLRTLLISLGVSALLGVIALLDSDLGDTQERLLLTALSTFGASAIVLSCGLAWERRQLGPIPQAGIVGGLLGFGVIVYAIWFQPDLEHNAWRRAYLTEIAIAAAATHASLVAVFGALRRSVWATYSAYGLNLLAVCLTLVAVWSDGPGLGFWQFYWIVIVLLVAVTIALPVLRRLAAADVCDAAEPAGLLLPQLRDQAQPARRFILR